MMNLDVTKTLEELDGEVWEDPGETTKLIRTCHELRKVPLKDITADQLRLMIGQRISLEHLIPIALKILAKDPFIQATFYRGDLLVYVLNNTNEEFWNKHDALYFDIDDIVREVKQTLEELAPLVSAIKPCLTE